MKPALPRRDHPHEGPPIPGRGTWHEFVGVSSPPASSTRRDRGGRHDSPTHETPARPKGRLRIVPIGTVLGPDPAADGTTDWTNVESEIIVDEDFEDGLAGIEAYTHLIVVFRLNQVRRYDLVHAVYGFETRPTGVFACRCPFRPNALGVTVVTLVGRRDNRLRVRGLDAWNGSPVLDVKPFLPQRDTPGKVPAVPLPHAPTLNAPNTGGVACPPSHL